MKDESGYKLFPEDETLTQKQLAFVTHYVTCGNAAEAARLSGYAGESAKNAGYHLLQHEGVKKSISLRQLATANSLNISKDKILTELEQLKYLALKEKKYKYVIEAIQEQCRLLGYYEARKIEVDRKEIKVSFSDNGPKPHAAKSNSVTSFKLRNSQDIEPFLGENSLDS